MNEIQITISALATAIILIEILNVGKYIKRIMKRNEFEFMKPWDCFPCMTFYPSIIYSIVFFRDIQTSITGVGLSLIVVYLFDRYIINSETK